MILLFSFNLVNSKLSVPLSHKSRDDIIYILSCKNLFRLYRYTIPIIINNNDKNKLTYYKIYWYLIDKIIFKTISHP